MTVSRLRAACLASALLLTGGFATAPALAFSQITGEDGTVPPGREGIVSVPLPPIPGAPEPSAPPPASQPTPPAGVAQETPPTVAPSTPPAPGAQQTNEAAPSDDGIDGDADAGAQEGARATPQTELPPIEIVRGDEGLPKPVRDLREKLMEAARSGDIEKLRPLLETGADPTVVSAEPLEQDPIQTLKDASGDGEGVELLAILLETLEASHVRLDADGENDIYVWPYFTQVNLEALTKPQLVELFELVTAGDYQRMVANGAYDFYRVGISPEGRFEFFVAGD
ncbi:hypothetical protein [Aureimonas sp. ME7]|uniref:hypothetical protein n=1 Tax=Aureimonas sp. ME7 TaxID=2744252 RepID=UPI0015F3A4AA|nr:hypothetical protein [Aureimonas sp. ME7]